MRRRDFTAALVLATTSDSFLRAAPSASGNHQWTSPFNGKSLDGWRTTGNASWTVEDGCLVGRQGGEQHDAAGDIFTVQQWAGFELECEWRMRFPGNSGLWFRVAGDHRKYGYQADVIDQPSHPNIYSGSLYCVGKAFIAENHDPTTVHRDGWNQLRVRAAGPSITIHMNKRQVIQINDATFPGPGSIGIQVHAGKEFAGMEVRLRNLRIRDI
jgi:hypothetical protein